MLKIRTTHILIALCAIQSCKPDIIDDIEPDIVADESNFVYASDEDGKAQIWVNRTSGTSKLTLNQDFQHIWPRISDDGSLILYYQIDGNEDVLDPSSSSLIVQDLGTEKTTAVINGTDSKWRVHYGADWSSDNLKLVFAGVQDSSTNSQLFICDADGSNARQISLRDDYNYHDPVFSPDGKHVYCSVVPEELAPGHLNSEIHKLDITNGNEYRITFNETADHHPCVNHDESKLIFESLLDPTYLGIGHWQLTKLDLNNLTQEPLLISEDLYFLPRFKTSSDEIYFVGLDVKELTTSIYVTDLAGKEPESLVSKDFNSIGVDPF